MAVRYSNMARVPKSPMADNFKLIKGIGPIIEQRLYNAGIQTFASLAALSAEEIAAIIPSMTAQQITKQGWITQAHKLAPNRAKSRHSQKKLSISTSRQHYENFTFEFLLDEKNKPRRLRLVHVQSGDVDTWAKWDAERLIDFLARHTGSRLPYMTSGIPTPIRSKLTSSQSVLTEPSSKALTETTLIPSLSRRKEISDTPSSLASESISQNPALPHNMTSDIAHQQGSSQEVITRSVNKIHLLEWKLLRSNTNQSLSKLSPDQSFDVRLTLDLNDATLSEGSALESNGTLYVKKLSGGQRQMLIETQEVVPYAKIISLTIGNTRLSEGYYRLEALVTLKHVGMETKRQQDIIAFLEIGILQVY